MVSTDDIRKAVIRALEGLLRTDGALFLCPVEVDSDYDVRKLHEVCINHQLANHLQRQLIPILPCPDSFFVDIEFNREGINYKGTMIDGQEELVRPDIIVHNRKSGNTKDNVLVVECKKTGAYSGDVEYDRKKIVALMTDETYDYRFGLQVQYGVTMIKAVFFSRPQGALEEEHLVVPLNPNLQSAVYG